MRSLTTYLLLLIFLLFGLSSAAPARATVASCAASVTPNTVTTNSTTTFVFTIENTDTVTYKWIEITRPSSNFTITGTSGSGWSTSSGEDTVTYTNGSLFPPDTLIRNITAENRTGEASSANWTVQVSDNSSGTNPFSCTGTLGTAIEGEGTDTFSPVISSIAVTNIAESSATITWTTDESATSVINYGTTASYGSTSTDTSLVTSHSVTLTGLSANTTYHYQVSSTDAASNASTSSDNTLVTSQATGDIAAPLLTSITVSSISATDATITWTTNEAADSNVEYGTSTSYGLSKNSSSLVTSHSLELTGLSANTTYHYQVSGTDASSNTGQAGDGNFTTSKTDTTSPSISSVNVSNISATSATITWTTSENADSTVDYGTTTSYGASQGSSTQQTSHSITLTSLSANTAYHYRVTSVDADSNTTSSADATFTTLATSSTSASPSLLTTETLILTTAPVPDTSPPTAEVVTDLSPVFTVPPTIDGTATDNEGVRSVEYSTDDGNNWLPVDVLDDPDAPASTFTFTPARLFDGNYALRLRVTDTSDNVSVSDALTLVIDRLPPRVGASLYATGSQQLTPSPDGTILTFAGLDQNITLSAVGGPTTIDLFALPIRSGPLNNPANEPLPQIYSLVKNPSTGLWSGTISFTQPGVYELIARATDGAGNTTERTLNSVVAIKGGTVSHDNNPVPGATVTVYYKEPTQQQFVQWDGRPFGQQNPQQTDNQGSYKLILPPGTYYLESTAPDFQTSKSRIFTVDAAVPLDTNIALSEEINLAIIPLRIPLPRFLFSKPFEIAGFLPIIPAEAKQTNTDLIDQRLPLFTLPHQGGSFNSISLRGKNSILTLLNGWSPKTSAQLSILDELAPNQAVNLAVIMSQETPSRVQVLQQQGRYNVLMAADPDGELVESLNLQSVPTHIFMDRQGFINQVIVGLMSQEELINNLP